jgi:uncharacterized repeat protein (TIGR02543 family)
MKVNSLFGKMKGKIGNMVLSSVGGEVIAREYNPNVANPNTTAQQSTRSRFKLTSQLSAALAPVIAIKRDGNVSGRNQFSKINFPATRINEGVAEINLNKIQLTKSQKAFAGFNANRAGGSAIAVQLNADFSTAVSRVVYIAYRKDAEGNLIMHDSKVCSVAGANGLFADSLAYTADSVVLYAYGVKDLEAGITTKFGNMTAPSAEDVAQLLISNTENMSSVQLTKTAGLSMAAGETTGDSDDVEHLVVSLVISGNGTATGNGRFEAGQNATLRATPSEGATFVGWKRNNASGELLSSANPYTFAVTENITVCAVFQGGSTQNYTIQASANPVAGGSVSGAGSYASGAQCTLVASAALGYTFDGWYLNGSKVSSNASYSFTVTGNASYEARFTADQPQGGLSNVAIDGQSWNTNRGDISGSHTYTGSGDDSLEGDAVFLVPASTKPTVGSVVGEPMTQPAVIEDGGFSFSKSLSQGEDENKMWLIAATHESMSYRITAVWDFYGIVPADGNYN